MHSAVSYRKQCLVFFLHIQVGNCIAILYSADCNPIQLVCIICFFKCELHIPVHVIYKMYKLNALSMLCIIFYDGMLILIKFNVKDYVRYLKHV